jgi:general secretion pathway protein F
MSTYQYHAMTHQGKVSKGIIESDSKELARHQLRKKNLIPVKLVEISGKKSKGLHSRASLSTKELALFTRQLAALLSSSMPLEETLKAMVEQAEKPRIRNIFVSVRAAVIEGKSFCDGLQQFPRAFPPIYVAAVDAGEQSGRIDLILEQLANYTERSMEINNKVQQAMIYPILMTLVSISIVGFLLAYVVPKMMTVFENLNATLPLATRLLLDFSSFIKADGLYLLIGVVVVGFAFSRAMRVENFKNRVQRFLLRVPIIGRALKTVNTSRFSKTFSMLSKSGVPIVEAMTTASVLVKLMPIRKAINKAIVLVKEGTPIHQALKQTHYFPSTSIHLIASGETSGKLEDLLERAAKMQEQDIIRLIDTSLTLFEPIIILVMGVVVLFIVLAILLPIFSLDQLAM